MRSNEIKQFWCRNKPFDSSMMRMGSPISIESPMKHGLSSSFVTLFKCGQDFEVLSSSHLDSLFAGQRTDGAPNLDQPCILALEKIDEARFTIC